MPLPTADGKRGRVMDDLISRQAAIDVAKQYWYKPDIAKALEELPSAQPEIVRCKDCQYQCKGQNECETWNLCGYRSWQYTPTTDEHFCSYAERREE